MTEDEKKEFEEFLQWKAEKAKLAEQEKQTEAERPEEKSGNSEAVPQESQKQHPASDTTKKVEKDGNNVGMIIAIGIVAIFILFLVLTGLSGNREVTQSTELQLDEVIADSDTIAVVDDYVDEKVKAVWDFTIEKDEMTDSKNIWASITSDNFISQEFPYEGLTHATIIVRYMKKYGYDVLIKISHGQINGREYYGTNYVTARFDEGNSKKYYFNESADGDSKVVFIRSHSDFIKNCKKAKTIKIDLPLYKYGRPVFTFKVDEPLTWREE